MDLQEQYDIVKPWPEKYYHLKAFTNSLHAERDDLKEQFQDLQRTLKRQRDFGQAFEETMSVTIEIVRG
ncbi:Hypothetical predicted protein [Xyrichtys novacula]|uniref:Uncharacterized protein n=1 Tax=Xyrichtys novacula TaxID=13765 RepID=A0AAV1EJ25_XYRNO|nr:Hypothetical predicted protein [Xyrichtys novacula]